MKPISHPVNDVTLPSDNLTIKMRPFTVKEEKIILFAAAGEARDEGKVSGIVKAITQVINNCIVTEGVDIGERPLFDILYAFIKLRAMTVSPYVSLEWTDPETNKVYPFKIDLNQVKVHIPEDHTNVIVLDENQNIGVKMAYPRLDQIPNFDIDPNDPGSIDALYHSLSSLVSVYWNGDDVEYLGQDYTTDDVIELLESLSHDQVEKIAHFFDTFPQIYYKAAILKEDKTVHELMIDEVAYFLF